MLHICKLSSKNKLFVYFCTTKSKVVRLRIKSEHLTSATRCSTMRSSNSRKDLELLRGYQLDRCTQTNAVAKADKVILGYMNKGMLNRRKERLHYSVFCTGKTTSRTPGAFLVFTLQASS